jgi:Zn-finger nucleic acid-binding protein
MKCPNDDTTLIMSERQNIEIDYCPTCRGVWLDRGELDKIIERSAPQNTETTTVVDERQAASYTSPVREERREERREYHDRDTQYHQGSYHKKKKRESFLGDLFDF